MKTILGYKVEDLIVVAEIMQRKGINDYELTDFAEAYLKGFKDGQEITKSNIEETVDHYKQSFEIGEWGKSFLEFIKNEE